VSACGGLCVDSAQVIEGGGPVDRWAICRMDTADRDG